MKKLIVSILIAVSLLSVAFITLASNNFAMLHIFNMKPVPQVIYDAVLNSINSEYHNLSIEVSGKNELDNSSLKFNVKLKLRAVGESFEFIGSIKRIDNVTYTGYYKEGTYYERSANGKTKQVCSFDDALNIFLAFDADYIFPVYWEGIYDFDEMDIKTSLIVAAFPFYVGQRFKALKEDYNAVVYYDLDSSGNLRRRNITITEESINYYIDIKHGLPKPFTLNFPDDLDTYITIV